MRTALLTLLAALLLTGRARAQAAPAAIIKLADLQRVLAAGGDTVRVVNFWATWCKPCVEEMPEIDRTARQYADRPVRFYLISLDFKADLARKVQAFQQRKALYPRVYLLDEPDYNSWLDQVDPSWQGAIPATLVFRTGRPARHFLERTVKPGELSALIDGLLP